MSGVSKSGSGTPNPHAAINHGYSYSEKNNYTARPHTFSGDYIDIIDIDDELWDILEDGIDIPVNGVGMVSDRKTLTLDQKRYIENIRVILVDTLPHSKYIKIIDKSTAKTIYESLYSTYEGNQQVKEVKANLLVQQY